MFLTFEIIQPRLYYVGQECWIKSLYQCLSFIKSRLLHYTLWTVRGTSNITQETGLTTSLCTALLLRITGSMGEICWSLVDSTHIASAMWKVFSFSMHHRWLSMSGDVAVTVLLLTALRARSMKPTWGPSGADRTQVGPMLAPWSLLCGRLESVLGGYVRRRSDKRRRLHL